MREKLKKAIYGVHAYSFGSLRKLYDWVLGWAESKYANAALFIFAFVESSFFPLPPDVLEIALCVSKPKKSFLYATIGTIGSVLGGVFGYLIGKFLYKSVGQVIINFFNAQNYFDLIGIWYSKHAFLSILGAAFTPIPYKVFTIAAGFWSIGLGVLIFASIIGRGARFFLIATMMYFLGPKMKEYIDRYFNIFSLIVFLLIVFGFIAIKYLV